MQLDGRWSRHIGGNFVRGLLRPISLKGHNEPTSQSPCGEAASTRCAAYGINAVATCNRLMFSKKKSGALLQCSQAALTV